MAKESRRVKIADGGFIHALKSYGPIFNPTPMTSDLVYKIILEGHIVYEYDNHGNCIRLDKTNFNNPERFSHLTNPQPTKKAEPYGKPVNVTTEAATFSGYTAQTAIPAPETAETAASPVVITPNMTNKQKKELRKAQYEARKAAEAAAAENTTETEATETAEVTE